MERTVQLRRERQQGNQDLKKGGREVVTGLAGTSRFRDEGAAAARRCAQRSRHSARGSMAAACPERPVAVQPVASRELRGRGRRQAFLADAPAGGGSVRYASAGGRAGGFATSSTRTTTSHAATTETPTPAARSSPAPGGRASLATWASGQLRDAVNEETRTMASRVATASSAAPGDTPPWKARPSARCAPTGFPPPPSTHQMLSAPLMWNARTQERH
jgi:hypothetical protein